MSPAATRFAPSRLTAALALAVPVLAWAQGAADIGSSSTSNAPQTITVSGRSAGNAASVAGFGDVPLSRAPFSATVITLGQLQDAGIAGIGDLTRVDAGTTDAYNAPGYWGQLAVRGFTLDNRFNYRRDGLPINAETAIAQGNKQALEILKGTSGLQAGTSAPGGLVNLVVKRPGERIRQAHLGWEQDGTLGLSLDVGDRAGTDGALGWRMNAGLERLDPSLKSSRGHRGLLALAGEARLGPGTLLEVEVESSRQSQPSTPGFSLLGDVLPSARSINPRTNLNNQTWSLPVVMDGQTGSVRLTQALGKDADLVAHAMRQRLRSDDRVAFPYGCYDAAADVYYADRYCPDGRFDLYDYRSEGERRTSDAMDLSINGRSQWLGMTHRFSAGVLFTRFDARFNRQAYNYSGSGAIDGLTQLPADPTLTDENTQRDERSTEWRLQDAITLSPRWSLWAGLRHTRLHRESVRTDGLRATSYDQSFTTPWLALSHALGPQTLGYLSWGQGVESEVAPGRSRYTNAGQPLPALKSEQAELGVKQSGARLDWRAAAFDMRRPLWSDFGTCDVGSSCTRREDGAARHRGVELEAEWRGAVWSVRGSAMALQARREGALEASLNGLRPVNVPATSLKLQGVYNVRTVPSLALLGFVTHEGERMVLPDNRLATPGWTRLDLGARWTQKAPGRNLVWRAGLDNVTDARAWKEAPLQFGHLYLYPLASRTLRLSLTAAL
jgi:iron complex outermembrane receptor protein